MALGTDIDTMCAIADTTVDAFVGGHADTDLALLLTTSTGVMRLINSTHPKALILLLALVVELIKKVWHLENP